MVGPHLEVIKNYRVHLEAGMEVEYLQRAGLCRELDSAGLQNGSKWHMGYVYAVGNQDAFAPFVYHPILAACGYVQPTYTFASKNLHTAI